MPRRPLDDPGYFLNRETSWLAFDRRVLEEAEDARNPLLERVKFLAITASNLDEFFEIRLAGLLQRIEDGASEPGPDGLSPAQERDLIVPALHEFVAAQYRCWNTQLRPGLAAERVHTLGWEELNPRARAFATAYCRQVLDPLLTPITVDPAHPFPRVLNKALCLAFLLRRKRRGGGPLMGVVTVPRALPRLIRLPDGADSQEYIFLASLVAAHAETMYRGYSVLASAAFRVTRNSNLYLQEEESRNLMESVRSELHNRRKGNAVRLEVEAGADAEIVERLRVNFELDPWQVFSTPGPVNLSRLFNLYEQGGRPELKYPEWGGRELHLTPKASDIFEDLRGRDILLHHPYDSYDGVVSFIEAGAADPRVLSIKQTLYRTSEDSPVLQALIEAAARKEVAVVVELKARFDEATNIRWARSLEDAGVQVFFGSVGRKTHCKMALLVRQDEDGAMRRYAHLGTGNYNHRTARLYTDLSLMTAQPALTAGVHAVFSYLTAYAEHAGYSPLLVAPVDLARRLQELIEREAAHARAGRPARIIAKVNALLDKYLIESLYRASRAGVEIDLIVRGACALRPGVGGVSQRIRVRSVVGRFLEHSRILYFANGGAEEVYLGSADWMPRNLYERVEVVFPVLDAGLRQRVRNEILAAYLADTAKARVLAADGGYRRAAERKGRRRFAAQEFFQALAEGRATVEEIPTEPARRRPRQREART